MTIHTTRFGDVDIEESKILHFIEGIPGLESYNEYALLTTEETEPFHWLQSLQDPDIALAVIHPHVLFPDYAPLVPENVFQELETRQTEDILILTVCVVPREYRRMTTNLVSPILVNTHNNKAKQIILENSVYQLRQPIYDALRGYARKEGFDARPDA